MHHETMALLLQVHKLYIIMYIECSYPKLNHDNVIEAFLQHYPAWIGLQIIHFKMFCVPVSTATSKVDKLLKMN